MIRLSPAQSASLADWFTSERPGPLAGPHVLLTGQGAAWADRLPDPRAVLMEAAGNYSFTGQAGVLVPASLPPMRGFIEAPEPFVPLLRAAFADLVAWERLVLELPAEPAPAPAAGAAIRPLGPADTAALAGLSEESAWICKTWGGAAGLAASGHAWGAWVSERLVSVAGTFFLGAQYEEVGVVTEPGYRGRGLSAACAAALCRDIRARGHKPGWSTSADNPASLRVAHKLGFVVHRRDVLYVTSRGLL